MPSGVRQLSDSGAAPLSDWVAAARQSASVAVLNSGCICVPDAELGSGLDMGTSLNAQEGVQHVAGFYRIRNY